MPKITEIHLACTPEEWEVLCLLIDNLNLSSVAARSLIDKISAINKRLVFASSIMD